MSRIKVEDLSTIVVKQEREENVAIKQEPREDLDDIDLYSEVISSQDAKFEKLLQEVEKLRNEKSLLLKSLNSLQKSCEKLQRELEGLQKDNMTLANNASTLFKTAQAEITRKDKMIQGLRKEKDDLLFRRSTSIRALRRSRRSVTVSPRKIRSPLKARVNPTPHKSTPRQDSEDSVRLTQGNEIGVKYDSKVKTQVSAEIENEVVQRKEEEEDNNRLLCGQEEEVEQEDEEEEEQQGEPRSGPDITYVPPPLLGPITMYSKRLYKKIHGFSPNKEPHPHKDLSNYPPHAEVNKQPSTETTKVQEIRPQENISPAALLKSLIDGVSKNFQHKETSQTSVTYQKLPMDSENENFVQPNDCKTPNLTSKLRLDTQEFIKLGPGVKPCKTSPPQQVIIDLRKLPKENYNSSERLVNEILNSSALKSDSCTSPTTSSTTAMTEIVDACKNREKDLNSSSTIRTELNKSELVTSEVKRPSILNQKDSFLDRTTSHESHRLNNRNRTRGNSNFNKPVISPVTFGRLVPHAAPKVIAKASEIQSISLGKDKCETQKRKYNTESPTETSSPVSVENTQLRVSNIMKKRKILDSLFGESPMKSDKSDLERKSPSPTQILPNSPSLDSDNSEDLVIDTTACSINSSPRLSECERFEGIEKLKTDEPSEDNLKVESISKTSEKHINNDVISSQNVGNETNEKENTPTPQILKEKSNYGLPDLSDCFSLDNDVKTNKSSFISALSEHNQVEDTPSKNFTAFVHPESKSHNIHENAEKVGISTPPRFVPSPPQQSGFTHSEHSLLNISVDTVDFISTLALTKGGNISPIRTPDKRHNTLINKMQSPKSDLCSGHNDHEPTANTNNLESDGEISQMNTVTNKETEANNIVPCHRELVDDKKPFVGDSSKHTQPQNPFKRRRPVRRICSINETKENLLTTNSNKESLDGKKDVPVRSDGDTNQKQCLNPHFKKEMQYPEAEQPKLHNPMLPNVKSKSSEQYRLIEIDKSPKKNSDVLLKQNDDHIQNLLKGDMNKSPSQIRDPRINSIANEQRGLTQNNILSTAEKSSLDLITNRSEKVLSSHSVKVLNVKADVMIKTTTAEIPSKVIPKTQIGNGLTDYLVKLINKDNSSEADTTSKPAKELNTNIRKIKAKTKEINASCEPIDLSMEKTQTTREYASGENKPREEKQAEKKLVIRKAAVETNNPPFKRSLSMKMAKPIPKVKFYDYLNKSSCDLNDGNAQKQAVNTEKELEEMPHVAKINQKIRVSTFQGNKPQHSKFLDVIPSIKNKTGTNKSNDFKLPGSKLKNEDKSIVKINKSIEFGSDNRRKISRRSVSVDRGLKIINKTKSIVGKQPRSKSNIRGNHNVNQTTPVVPVKKDEVKIKTTLNKFELHQHSRRSESESPDRERIANLYLRQAGDKTSSNKRENDQSKNKSHDPKIKNITNHELSTTSQISPERSTGSKLNPLNDSENSNKNLRRSVSAERVLVKKNRQNQMDQQMVIKNIKQCNCGSDVTLSENSVKSIQSRSPSPVKRVKFELDYRRSQSISPDRRRSSRHFDSEIQTPRRSSKSRNDTIYQETKNTYCCELKRSSSNSSERTPSSKYHHLHRSRESDSPEPKISRRSYHQSRRMHRSPTEEFRNSSRKRSRSPPHTSSSRISRRYRERSPSPDPRHHRYVKPRNRSRTQYENFRSRSPRSYYKRSSSCHEEREPLPYPSSSGNHNRQFSRTEKYDAEHVDVLALGKKVRELEKLLEIKVGKASQSKDHHQEKKRIDNMLLPEIIPGSKKVDDCSRSPSLLHSQKVNQPRQIQNNPESGQTCLLQETKEHIHISSTSNVHSQNERMDINSQQLAYKTENESLKNQKEGISKDNVSTTSKLQTKAQVPVMRVKRRARNLGDSEARAILVTVKKDT